MMKRLFDVITGFTLFVLLSPLFVIIGLLIKLDSRGPVFFVQTRLGRGGKEFVMFKFRTMVENAEQMGTGLFSYADDPRITRVGRLLRMVSLDEVPQIINVLIGNMSLVGPRPPVLNEIGNYDEFTEHMKVRFTVKPGVTGLAQVSGRNELNWDQKIELDNLYVKQYQKWGIFVDIVILIRTFFVVLSMRNIIEKKAENE